jgi:YesN/AraC family two-component response regulator
MKALKQGSYFGVNKKKNQYKGLIIAETEYMAPIEVPWHYHENPYFTYFIKGYVLEVNKKTSYSCTPGTVVFHNHHEPHYNTEHSDYFHAEVDHNWLERQQLSLGLFEGSAILDNCTHKDLFNRIYKEFLINDTASGIAIEGLMLQVFSLMQRNNKQEAHRLPVWVCKVKELIHSLSTEELSLQYLSDEIGIHPSYLSQLFPKYFGVNFGEYIRKERVHKATTLLRDKHLSCTEIAYDCGFSDQSHFIRCFKTINGMTPAQYRKVVLQY